MDKYQFRVEPFCDDVTGRLSWGVLGNTLLRVAEKSAITHGFGYDTVHERNTAWVLSRLMIEMKRMPKMGETYNASTWVAKIYRQFTDRLFQLTDENDQAIGYAGSVWALIDLDTRQPVSLESYDNPRFHAAMDTATIPLSGYTRSRFDLQTPQRTLDVVQSDLDINGHFNSIRYLQLAVDSVYIIYKECLDVKRQVPFRIEMTYASETFYGDTLRVYTQSQGGGEYHVALQNSNGVAAKAVIFFQDLG